MYQIIVKGTAETDFENLKQLDGISCDDCFSEYLPDDEYCEPEERSLAKKVKDGFMSFQYEDGKLWTITEYKSNEELTTTELIYLLEFTTGQWSDGIGEGFEQNPVYIDNEEIYISPWHYNQKAMITQYYPNGNSQELMEE